MYDILFICAANVGRSQMAEGFYNHYTQSQQSMSGAGVQDVRAKYNFRPHPGIVQVMREQGIDITIHTVKLVDRILIEQARHVMIFFEEVQCPDALQNDLASHTDVVYRPVQDPYDPDGKLSELDRFRQSRDTIDQIIKELLRK